MRANSGPSKRMQPGPNIVTSTNAAHAPREIDLTREQRPSRAVKPANLWTRFRDNNFAATIRYLIFADNAGQCEPVVRLSLSRLLALSRNRCFQLGDLVGPRSEKELG